MSSYKPHYACFSCRKTFKRRLIWDVDRDHMPRRDKVPAKCPDCGQLMADMGLDFESPKKNDTKAWRHIQELYIADITFHSCGCTGPGFIPKDHTQLLSHLSKIKEEYICHRRFWEQEPLPSSDSEKRRGRELNEAYIFKAPMESIEGTRKNRTVNRQKAAEYWNNRIKEVETRLGILKSA